MGAYRQARLMTEMWGHRVGPEFSEARGTLGVGMEIERAIEAMFGGQVGFVVRDEVIVRLVSPAKTWLGWDAA